MRETVTLLQPCFIILHVKTMTLKYGCLYLLSNSNILKRIRLCLLNLYNPIELEESRLYLSVDIYVNYICNIYRKCALLSKLGQSIMSINTASPKDGMMNLVTRLVAQFNTGVRFMLFHKQCHSFIFQQFPLRPPGTVCTFTRVSTCKAAVNVQAKPFTDNYSDDKHGNAQVLHQKTRRKT